MIDPKTYNVRETLKNGLRVKFRAIRVLETDYFFFFAAISHQ
jgi:hypothetical protein